MPTNYERHAHAAAAAAAAAELEAQNRLAAADIVQAVESEFGSVLAAIDSESSRRRPASNGPSPGSAMGTRASSATAARLGLSPSQPTLPTRPSTSEMMRLPPSPIGPLQRPGSATRLQPLQLTPAVDAPSPAMVQQKQELTDARERNRQLEREIKSVKLTASQARARLQAFADSNRHLGLSAPPDGTLAFWEEARALLDGAITQQYGASLRGQQLTPGELKRVRMVAEQRSLGGGADSGGVGDGAGLHGGSGRLFSAASSPGNSTSGRTSPQAAAASKARGGGAGGGPVSSSSSPEGTVTIREHREALRLLRNELEAERERAAAAAAAEGRAALSDAASAHKTQAGLLSAQLAETRAAAAERAMTDEAKAKMERIDLLSRQVARRMANRDLAAGWSAWFDFVEAKVYAMSKLRAAGGRLRAPELSMAFEFWQADSDAAKRRCEAREAARQAASLDLQLKEAEYDARRAQTVPTQCPNSASPLYVNLLLWRHSLLTISGVCAALLLL